MVNPSKLESEQVIVEAPFSFVGVTKRVWRANENIYFRIFLSIPFLCCAYFFICNWYLFFGLLLVPFRLYRRSQRNAHKQELQHRELLAQLQNNKEVNE